MVTHGAELLAERIAERKLSQTKAAELFDVTQSMVSRWLDGSCRPDEFKRRIIASRLGVPVEAWFTSEERTELAKADESGAVPAVCADDVAE